MKPIPFRPRMGYGMRFLISSAILGVLSFACQQPTATPPQAATPPASRTVAQHHETKEPRLTAAYPGLQTLSEAFPEGSFTIDAQDAATRGILLLAGADQGFGLQRGYDLERTADGRIVLSFFAAETDDGIGPLYFVQLQCSDEQANALRKRPSRFPLRVIFRLTSASARPILDLRSPEDKADAPPMPSTVDFYQTSSRVLRGTLVAFSPFDSVPD